VRDDHRLCQFIVSKYVKENINWPREIKIAQKLTDKYTEYNFWKNCKDIKLPSLAWFLTDNGKNFLDFEVKLQSLKETFHILNIELKEEKIGEDKNTCQKPKSLIEFIRLWEENQKKKIQQ
jgi:hypothetical protein